MVLPATPEDLMGRFEAELEKARHQLHLKLISIDPLDEEQLEAVFAPFNQRLTELQRDFREHLIRPGDEQVPPIGQFALTAPSLDRDAELNAGIAVGGMVAILVFSIPVRLLPLWIVELVETPADVIGDVLNLHPGFVTVGVGFFAGSLAALATSLLLRPNRRELLREALMFCSSSTAKWRPNSALGQVGMLPPTRQHVG